MAVVARRPLRASQIVARLAFAPLLAMLAHCAGIVGISDVPGGDAGDTAVLRFDAGLGSMHDPDGSSPPDRSPDAYTTGEDTGPEDEGGVTPPAMDGAAAYLGDGGTLGFHASNLGALTFDPSVTGPLKLVQDNCRIYTNTDYAEISCYGGENPPMDVFPVNLGGGAGKALIYVFTDISIDDQSSLQFTGPNPIILVALGSVDIAGQVDASADLYDEDSPAIPGERLTGPGVGGFNNGGPQGGGGGSFCGTGGEGASGSGAKPGGSSPGMTYGTADLVPLWGGSPGGGANTGDADSANGNGGGAIQISAMTYITIEPTAYITVNGSGGVAGGDQTGEGGGSGGAILLEAPTVTVKGILEANGGEGSDPNSDGADPPNDAGAPREPSQSGGTGGWGAQVNGANGSPAAGTSGEGMGYGGGAEVRVASASTRRTRHSEGH